MPGFKYDPAIGSFKGWLQQITRRRVVDHLRKRRPEEQPARDGGSVDPMEEFPDITTPGFDELWEAEWQEHLLRTAMARVKRKTHPKQLQMFNLYVTQHWPMKAVMDTLGVNAAQVYMAKMRVSRLIKAEVRRLQSQTT
jgi:RNA polymerase sigma-70 factor (ECF subfamily)